MDVDDFHEGDVDNELRYEDSAKLASIDWDHEAVSMLCPRMLAGFHLFVWHTHNASDVWLPDLKLINCSQIPYSFKKSSAHCNSHSSSSHVLRVIISLPLPWEPIARCIIASWFVCQGEIFSFNDAGTVQISFKGCACDVGTRAFFFALCRCPGVCSSELAGS